MSERERVESTDRHMPGYWPSGTTRSTQRRPGMESPIRPISPPRSRRPALGRTQPRAARSPDANLSRPARRLERACLPSGGPCSRRWQVSVGPTTEPQTEVAKHCPAAMSQLSSRLRPHAPGLKIPAAQTIAEPMLAS
jgi:hypothetical protein